MAYWMIEDEANASMGGDGMLPPVGKVVQAAAFGAILGGATTGAVNAMRVKSGEIDSDEAVHETAQMAARSAASMAIASVAAHVVRVYPLVGVLTLVAVGAAIVSMSKKKPVAHSAARPRAAAEEGTKVAPAAKVAPRAAAARRPRSRKPAKPSTTATEA